MSAGVARVLVAGAFLLLAGCGGQGEEQGVNASADLEDIATIEPRPSPSPAPKVPCAVTGTRETATDCAELEQGLAGLKAGIDAFRPEQPMIRDQPTIVRYSIEILPQVAQGPGGALATPGEGASQQDIDRAVAETETRVSGNVAVEAEREQVETGRITVGGRMFACLSGDRVFEIEPQACTSYNMIETPNPVWQWQVTPLAGGRTYKLFLRSGIEIEGPDGQPRRVGRYSKTEEIAVDVSTLGKVQDTMRGLEAWIRTPLGVVAALTALVAALGGLIAAVRKARGAKAGGAPKGGG